MAIILNGRPKYSPAVFMRDETAGDRVMKIARPIKLGHIPYLNCVPFFYFLEESGFSGELVSGVPSELNRLLHQGKLDVSPSSSFEYAYHWEDYFLLPGHSISSQGKVQSVLLFSPVEMSELEGKTIAITGESATSINLLRVILLEFYHHQRINDFVPDGSVEDLVSAREPALLIGDRALLLATRLPDGVKCFDLGEIWYQQTGLPFVFALWMIRKAAFGSFQKELSLLGRHLQYSLERVLENPEEIVSDCTSGAGLSPQQVIQYWQNIDYRLDKEHLAGLNLFFQLCAKHQLLDKNPPLNFLPDLALGNH